jgi:hypothetical protein
MTNSIQNPDLEPRADGRIPVDMVCLIDTLAANVPSLLKDLTAFVRPALWILPGYELAPLRIVHHIFSKECKYFETRWDWRGLYSNLDSTMKRQAIKTMALYERTFRGDTPSVDEWKAMHLSARRVAEDRRTTSSPHWLLKERLLRLKRADVQQGTSEYREWWREFHRSPLIPMMWRALFGALVASGCAFALYRHWIAAVLCLTASYVPHLRIKITTHTRKLIRASIHAESSLVVSAALAGLRWAQREELSLEVEQLGLLGGSEFAKTVESAIEFSVAKEIESHEEIQRLTGRWFEESRSLGEERLAETRRGCCLHYAIDMTKCVGLALSDRSALSGKSS